MALCLQSVLPITPNEDLSMYRLPHLILTSLLAFTCACAADGPTDSDDDTRADGTSNWGYEGDKGPEKWAEIDVEAYSACDIHRTDQRQSPVDIPADSTKECGTAASSGISNLNYNKAPTTAVDNGHTLQISFPASEEGIENFMVADGEVYELLQYHVHTPSEHVVSGKEYPLEIHLVHKADSGKLAVLGLFAEVSDDCADRDGLVFPPQLGATPEDGLAINAMDLIGASIPKVYAYSGSLTTPPCSEIVSWYVAADPICISPAQLGDIESRIDEHTSSKWDPVDGSNARRPIPELQGREVRLCEQ